VGDPSLHRGDVLAGRYRVERELGAGAMGHVLLVTDLQAKVHRAVKLMRKNAIEDRVAVARFLREARACSQLRGEHVAHVHEAGRLPDGVPYMVMEYLEGRDLRAELEARGALPLPEAMLVMIQACEAVAEAHRRNIVHRDLKPANIFLAKKKGGGVNVKVVDFGISKILGDAGSSGDTTRSNVMLGSPHYMSPEAMRSSRDVDARTDVWSLGVVTYQVLTGRVPFEGKGLTQIITNVLQGRPAPPSRLVKGIPRAVDDAVLGCLVTDRDERCPSVVDFAAALEPFAPPEAKPSLDRIMGRAPATPQASPSRRARRVPTVVLLALAFAVGCALALLYYRLR
jgi:serine/threonine-protein kinase